MRTGPYSETVLDVDVEAQTVTVWEKFYDSSGVLIRKERRPDTAVQVTWTSDGAVLEWME